MPHRERRTPFIFLSVHRMSSMVHVRTLVSEYPDGHSTTIFSTKKSPNRAIYLQPPTKRENNGPHEAEEKQKALVIVRKRFSSPAPS